MNVSITTSIPKYWNNTETRRQEESKWLRAGGTAVSKPTPISPQTRVRRFLHQHRRHFHGACGVSAMFSVAQLHHNPTTKINGVYFTDALFFSAHVLFLSTQTGLTHLAQASRCARGGMFIVSHTSTCYTKPYWFSQELYQTSRSHTKPIGGVALSQQANGEGWDTLKFRDHSDISHSLRKTIL